MFGNKEIKKLQDKIDELANKIDKISEKQNSQFTDMIFQLKETRDEISNAKDNSKLLVDGDEEGIEDSLYEEAKKAVLVSGKASTSWLQRKLGIGYSRSAKLIDTLEQEGVIGTSNGLTPREILLKK
jgi:S-DNA-T family DNA segregation ATPase FtsK/SpoIIIE